MNTREVGERLVALCQEAKNLEAIDSLYAEHVISLEATEPMKEIHGVEGVREKNVWWFENHEVHEGRVEGPFVNADHFAVRFFFEVTPKATGERTQLDEVAVYEVRNGQIVRETFLY